MLLMDEGWRSPTIVNCGEGCNIIFFRFFYLKKKKYKSQNPSTICFVKTKEALCNANYNHVIHFLNWKRDYCFLFVCLFTYVLLLLLLSLLVSLFIHFLKTHQQWHVWLSTLHWVASARCSSLTSWVWQKHAVLHISRLPPRFFGTCLIL